MSGRRSAPRGQKADRRFSLFVFFRSIDVFFRGVAPKIFIFCFRPPRGSALHHFSFFFAVQGPEYIILGWYIKNSISSRRKLEKRKHQDGGQTPGSSVWGQTPASSVAKSLSPHAAISVRFRGRRKPRQPRPGAARQLLRHLSRIHGAR